MRDVEPTTPLRSLTTIRQRFSQTVSARWNNSRRVSCQTKRLEKTRKGEVFMKLGRRTSPSPCIALLLLACCAISGQNEQPRVRNIVLVHGAWADGSGWKGV